MTIPGPTPGNLIDTVDQLVEAVNAGSSGTIPVPAADTGYVLDTTTYDNPITGSGKMTVAVFPVDTVLCAVALNGDAFPRLIIAIDPTDFASIMLGNGTANPAAGGPSIGSAGNDLVMGVPGGSLQLLGSVLGCDTFHFTNLRSNDVPPATVLGTVTNKMEIFDASGGSIGFIPVYDSIT